MFIYYLIFGLIALAVLVVWHAIARRPAPPAPDGGGMDHWQRPALSPLDMDARIPLYDEQPYPDDRTG